MNKIWHLYIIGMLLIKTDYARFNYVSAGDDSFKILFYTI